MNSIINFAKKNALFLGLIGGFVVLLLGSLYLLKRQIEKSELARDARDQAKNNRTGLWSGNPYPSSNNINTIRKNEQAEAELLSEAFGGLYKSTLPLEAKNGSSAQSEILRVCQDMEKLLGDSKNPIGYPPPPKFKFGFEDYGKIAPKDNDAPLILKQLKITRILINLLAHAKVSKIEAVRRAEFEKTGIVSSSDVYSPSSEPLISMGNDFKYISQTNYLYRVMPFQLKIECTTESLRTFLNSLCLSKMPHIFLVRGLNIENEKPKPIDEKEADKLVGQAKEILSPSAQEVQPIPEGGTLPESSPPPKDATPGDPTQLPFVFGEEKIIVGMRIEYIEFPSSEEPSKPRKEPDKKEPPKKNK